MPTNWRSPKLREQIALTVGEVNGCHYCVSAHSALGRMAGLSDDDLVDARRGNATDGKADTALRFARTIVEKRGLVSDEDVDRVRNAGFDDAEISEIVAAVALNIFTNYFNHVADTEVDFPEVKPLEEQTACACS